MHVCMLDAQSLTLTTSKIYVDSIVQLLVDFSTSFLTKTFLTRVIRNLADHERQAKTNSME